ncbi:helix-turn-helix domain-containing protein [Desulfoluna spongiiphila]|uniref:helix-turn-helix domain-containing protein n=1 Tax=Desulfoluna spongiiphila TaxID=419481 RepID=UPI001252F64A|nr:helix-turn-helix domain-containing protein [Desulfoluna spongiiphila]VVS92223.1 helix-turn-helix domain [Desulfoluna spongiiphila]
MGGKRKKYRKRAIPMNCLSIEQTAAIVGIGKRTLQCRMAPSGIKKWGKFGISAQKRNGIWVFKRSDVEAYMSKEFDEDITIK